MWTNWLFFLLGGSQMCSTWIWRGCWLRAEADIQEAMKDESGAEYLGAALFEDLGFPCTDKSLFSDGTTPIAKLQGAITWRRPQVSDRVSELERFLESPCDIDVLDYYAVSHILTCHGELGRNFHIRWLNWWWKIVMKTKCEMGK